MIIAQHPSPSVSRCRARARASCGARPQWRPCPRPARLSIPPPAKLWRLDNLSSRNQEHAARPPAAPRASASAAADDVPDEPAETTKRPTPITRLKAPKTGFWPLDYVVKQCLKFYVLLNSPAAAEKLTRQKRQEQRARAHWRRVQINRIKRSFIGKAWRLSIVLTLRLLRPFFWLALRVGMLYNTIAAGYNDFTIREAERHWYWAKRHKPQAGWWHRCGEWLWGLATWFGFFMIAPFKGWILLPPFLCGVFSTPTWKELPFRPGTVAVYLFGYLKFMTWDPRQMIAFNGFF